MAVADSRGRRPCRRLGGQPGWTAERSQGQSLRRTPIGTAASVHRVVGLADGRPGKTAVHWAVSYADGQQMARRTGGHTSTSRNGHLQHQDPKPPPSAGRSGFYPGVKMTKSGCQRTSRTSDVLTTLLRDHIHLLVFCRSMNKQELHRKY